MNVEYWDMVIDACARASHEAFRAYCIARGDVSKISWEETPEWQRESWKRDVEGVLFEGNGPRESHASWLVVKEKDGWRYAPVLNVSAKEHPCMVPYDELPERHRKKDDIFVAVVTVMAKAFA